MRRGAHGVWVARQQEACLGGKRHAAGGLTHVGEQESAHVCRHASVLEAGRGHHAMLTSHELVAHGVVGHAQ